MHNHSASNIPTLCAKLTSTSSSIILDSLKTLNNLIKVTHSNAEKISECNIIPRLLNLMGQPRYTTAVVSLLANLCGDKKACSKVIELNGITPLVRLMHCLERESVLSRACRALCNIASSSRSAAVAVFRTDGSTTAIVDLLDTGKSKETFLVALRTLRVLLSSNRDQLIKFGVIKPVMKFWREHTALEERVLCLDIMISFSSGNVRDSSAIKQIRAEDGFLVALVEMAENDSLSVSNRTKCLRILTELTQHFDILGDLGRSSVIGTLLKALKSGDSWHSLNKSTLIRALCRLCYEPFNRDRIADSGCFDLFVETFRDDQQRHLWCVVAAALNRYRFDENACEKLRHCGLIDALLERLKELTASIATHRLLTADTSLTIENSKKISDKRSLDEDDSCKNLDASSTTDSGSKDNCENGAKRVKTSSENVPGSARDDTEAAASFDDPGSSNGARQRKLFCLYSPSYREMQLEKSCVETMSVDSGCGSYGSTSPLSSMSPSPYSSPMYSMSPVSLSNDDEQRCFSPALQIAQIADECVESLQIVTDASESHNVQPSNKIEDDDNDASNDGAHAREFDDLSIIDDLNKEDSRQVFDVLGVIEKSMENIASTIDDDNDDDDVGVVKDEKAIINENGQEIDNLDATFYVYVLRILYFMLQYQSKPVEEGIQRSTLKVLWDARTKFNDSNTRYVGCERLMEKVILQLTDCNYNLIRSVTSGDAIYVLHSFESLHDPEKCVQCGSLKKFRDRLLHSLCHVAGLPFGSGELANKLLVDQRHKLLVAISIGLLISNKVQLAQLMFDCDGLELLLDQLENQEKTMFDSVVASVGMIIKRHGSDIPSKKDDAESNDAEALTCTCTTTISDDVIELKTDDGGSIRVSKKNLSSRSPYFAAMFSGAFAESQTTTVNISHISSGALACIVRHFCPSKHSLVEGDLKVADALDVFGNCDMFLLSDEFKNDVEEYLCRNVDAESVVQVFQRAISFENGVSLRYRCIELMFLREPHAQRVAMLSAITESSVGPRFLDDLRNYLGRILGGVY